MMILSEILCLYAILLLAIALLVYRLGQKHTPPPEPCPTLRQVNGVIEVYEILGMYEGIKQ